VTILGEVPAQQALRRNGAQPGDEVWVSGTLGDAALALAHLQGRIELSAAEFATCSSALHQPLPRIALGSALRGVASSAIDISDGLLADLGHILDASKVAAEIEMALLPISPAMRTYAGSPIGEQCILSGGDDYELCFTVPAAQHGAVSDIGARLGLPLTCIGRIVAGSGCSVLDPAGNRIDPASGGYEHFR